MRRAEGYIRLACRVLECPPEPYLAALGLLKPQDAVFEVKLRNQHYTGELMGVWFEEGQAQVDERTALRFARRGFELRTLNAAPGA